ncbi:hypothetical protein Golob_005661 [Gossypium lobatum]|uniref:Uncharacterized protein n=1 Tax=Gossypium lobatum TaxID=34289 RepID=A0A7J8MTX2_9ROSI|nr:hypothetical protein [Gossypium lobatum]
MTRPYDAIWETITIRGKEMRVTPREICEFYNVAYYENSFLDNINLDTFRDIDMDDVVKYLTEGKDVPGDGSVEAWSDVLVARRSKFSSPTL